MRMSWYRTGPLLTALVLTGCSREAAPQPVADSTARIPEKTDAALADWLALPRQELARKCDDWKGTVEKQLDTARTDRQSVLLLPRLLPSLTVPVLQEAKYSERFGFSLPPYAVDGVPDSGLALHLARHGDAQAGQKLIPPGDADLLHRIEDLHPGRNYPVEWSRLVALVQLSAQVRLANGEVDGAADLIQIHKQLLSVLDAKAAAGPLGAALLPAGRRALAQATEAWKEAGKAGLAQDARSAVDGWGESPAPSPLLPLGADSIARALMFPRGGEGHAVAALGKDVARAADLLALPVPVEELEGIVGLVDARGMLAEYLALYRVRASETFPEPVQLAQLLVDHGFDGREVARSHGIIRQTYSGGGLSYEVGVVSRGNPIGGFVRVTDAKETFTPATLPPNSRDFGAVHLDRSFEQNRVSLAPSARSADTLEVMRSADAARVVPPGLDAAGRKALPPPTSVVLKRQGTFNVLGALTLRWSPEHNTFSLDKLLVPLWTAYGAARLEGDTDADGTHLVFVWEDERTRYTLRMPHSDEQSPELVAEDRVGPDGADKRAASAEAFDRKQRKLRLNEGRPLLRLPRSLDAEPGVSLGMTRETAVKALRRSESIRQRGIPDGVSRFFLTSLETGDAFFPQQSFIRFGTDGKVAELRVRYQEKPRGRDDRSPTLLLRMSALTGEAPDPVPAEWARLWPDLPPQRPTPTRYRWLDDRTVLSLQRDAGGAEVVLRDCPPDEPEGVKLQLLEFCSRGPEGVMLGDTREELLKRWQVSEPTRTSDGGLVLPTSAKSPYDVAVVYLDGEKVTRVLARHRAEEPLTSAQVPAALQQAWAQDLDRLGNVRRQDPATGVALPGYGWHDERTRVRTFGQEGGQGTRLFTEWREWPVSSGKTAGEQTAANKK